MEWKPPMRSSFLCDKVARKGMVISMKRTFSMDKYYAHRGLHDENFPENSLGAFRNAIAHGIGVEFDVLKTADDVLVVFHDDTLQRMCGVQGRVTESTYHELRQLRLKDSTEYIPTLEEVLSLIDGKIPLIIEIKSEGDWKKTTKLLAKRLERYEGEFVIESFHPFVLNLYRKLQPETIRGQLSNGLFCKKDTHNLLTQFLASKMFLNVFSRPDFIAFKWQNRSCFCFHFWTKIMHKYPVAWTVRHKEEIKKIEKDFKSFIFEGFLP